MGLGGGGGGRTGGVSTLGFQNQQPTQPFSYDMTSPWPLRRYILAFKLCTATNSSSIVLRKMYSPLQLGMRPLSAAMSPRRFTNHAASLPMHRHILLHHRRWCTQLCPCSRHTWLESISLILGTQLLPQHIVSATITSFPHVRVFVLLLGLKRLENTDGATLSICCLNACITCLDSSAALIFLRKDPFRVCFGSDQADALC